MLQLKKNILFYSAAKKEFLELPDPVKTQFRAIIGVLELKGELREPEGKKLGSSNLFEMRVRYKGQWRGIYFYYLKESIIILRFFQKKPPKTPLKRLRAIK